MSCQANLNTLGKFKPSLRLRSVDSNENVRTSTTSLNRVTFNMDVECCDEVPNRRKQNKLEMKLLSPERFASRSHSLPFNSLEPPNTSASTSNLWLATSSNVDLHRDVSYLKFQTDSGPSSPHSNRRFSLKPFRLNNSKSSLKRRAFSTKEKSSSLNHMELLSRKNPMEGAIPILKVSPSNLITKYQNSLFERTSVLRLEVIH